MAFELRHAPNGVAYYHCPELGAPHGFSTRVGGKSRSPYAGLNLGFSSGDAAEAVERNRAAWREALGLKLAPLSLHQVHGAAVHAVDAPFHEAPQGDVIVTGTPGLAVGVFTADCTPILMHDPVTGAVGAVHAGWRGTVARAVAEAVRALESRFGADPQDMRAAVGPAIGPCCFEVGHEVAAAAEASGWHGWRDAVLPRSPRPHFDLFAANRDQLLEAGLRREHVFVSGLCTACEADMFYSWRRDAGQTGRMQSAIVCRGTAS